MSLKNQKIFITGGTGGIGVPLIALLKEAGAEIVAYNNKTDGDLVQNINNVCTYLSNNTPDILINMAGCNDFNYCENQDISKLVNLNLYAPIRLMQAVLPQMKARDSGHIVNIGSMAGLIPLPHVTGYSASKAGLKAFSDALRRELSGANIIISHIAPRAVETAMNTGFQTDLNRRTNVQSDKPEIVAQRIFQAIMKREIDVRIGRKEKFFSWLNTILPKMIDNGLKKTTLAGNDVLNGVPFVENQEIEETEEVQEIENVEEIEERIE